MSEKPPAGWYPDASGVTRWWDGQQWTEHQQPQAAAPAPTTGISFAETATATRQDAPPRPVAEKPAKKKRIFLWFFLAVQVVFILWIFGGASSAGSPEDCGSLDAETCQAAADIGTGLGVAMIVIMWMVVDFMLALVYGVYRLAKRS